MTSFTALARQTVPSTRALPSVRALWAEHAHSPSASLRSPTISDLLRRRRPPALAIDLLSYNTYLLEVRVDLREVIHHFSLLEGIVADHLSWFGIDSVAGKDLTNFPVPIDPKPQVAFRANSIGGALGRLQKERGPFVAALSEVWTDAVRDLLLGALREKLGGGVSTDVVVGPQQDEDWRRDAHLAGSGLLTLGAGVKVSAGPSHTFRARGKYDADVDWYSSKGVQLTYVELPGVGVIDLYSTHLHSGGDLPTDNPLLWLVIGSVVPPTEPEKQAVRVAQLSEIVAFKEAHGDPSHVAVLTGDFNIDAGDIESYRELVVALNGSDFALTWEEVWSKQFVGTAFGATTNGEPGPEIPVVCAFNPPYNAKAEKTCREPQPTKLGSRIDYLFIERPTDKHRLTVDACVVERLPFLREPQPIKIRHRGGGSGKGGGPGRYSSATYDPTRSQPFASDHLGLLTRLLCAPK